MTGAAVVHVLGALLDAQVLAGQAIAVALAGLAALALFRSGRGRFVVAGGIGVLAVDALVSAQSEGDSQYLSHFSYAPLGDPRAYSAAEDAAWLGDSLAAQLTAHWAGLLGILLVCVGAAVTLADAPRGDARWPRRVAWAVVAVVALIVLAGVVVGGGELVRQLVTLGALLPTLVALAAALTVLVVAAGRQRRVAVPASVGAFLLAAAVLSTELSQVGPVRPSVLTDFYGSTEVQLEQVTVSAQRATTIGVGASSGLLTGPLLALLPLIAIALLVLALPPTRDLPAPGQGTGTPAP